MVCDDSKFYCFTTTTKTSLTQHQHFRTEVSAILLEGSTCLPKECVIDFRILHEFDDILMSKRINTGRVCVIGELSNDCLAAVASRVRDCRILERKKKSLVCASLGQEFGGGQQSPSS